MDSASIRTIYFRSFVRLCQIFSEGGDDAFEPWSPYAEEIRDMGWRLHEEGGRGLMDAVFHLFNYGEERKTAVARLEWRWDGIGV